MYYYKKFTATPYVGTDETTLIASEYEIEIDYEEERQTLFDCYGHLINGFYDPDPTDEDEEWFKEECEIDFQEISQAEFDELAEEGYDVEVR